jgi:glycosyltransferase involved in cell wall biosynthesis
MSFRLVMVISGLQAGGAERVMSSLANYWADVGWDVHLMTLDGTDVLPFYSLDPRVTHHRLDVSQRASNLLSGTIHIGCKIHRLRAAIRRVSAEVVISFLDDVNIITVLATRRLQLPVIVCVRTDPRAYRLRYPWRLLRPWAYRRATCVVAQTQAALDYFSASIRRGGSVIPNPVVPVPEFARHHYGTCSGRGRVVLAMGRLQREKGFDCLIEAFAKIAGTHSDWTLEIWGEGRERQQLEMMIGQFGLQGRIRLPGLTRDPAEKMRRADLFILSSRYEGFPNVLCEAMASGLPVIAADCRSGPSDIVRDGVDGVLVPPENSHALARAMDRLMSNDAERTRLASAATEVLHRFSLSVVMSEWTELCRRAARGTANKEHA